MGDKLREWNRLVSLLVHVNLEEEQDIFVWKANQKSIFSVKSMYTNLVNEHCRHDDCIAWKLRLPMKIKIFLWYLKKGVILTKDNLLKRKWKGDGNAASATLMKTFNICFLNVI